VTPPGSGNTGTLSPRHPVSAEPPVAWAPRPPRRERGSYPFADFLTFRSLITPRFITLIYAIGVVWITLAAAVVLLQPATSGAIVSALFFLVIGNLWWRVIVEFVLVLFRINESLQSINRRGGGM
jgi:hypothetical protein